ncbi:MAG: hypothetical protein R3F65_30015 [bacterium]
MPAGEMTPAALEDRLVAPFSRGEISTAIRALDQCFGGDVFTLRALFRDEQRVVVDRILEGQIRQAEEAFGQLHARTGPMMRFLTELGTPPPAVFRHAAEGMINGRLRRLFAKSPIDVRTIDALVDEARMTRVRLDEVTLGYALSAAVARHADALAASPRDLDALRALDAMCDLAERMPFEVDRWLAQSVMYDLHVTVHAAMAADDSEDARAWVETFTALGERLHMLIALPEVAA